MDANTVLDGIWHFAAATRTVTGSSSTLTLFLDGVTVSMENNNLDVVNDNLSLRFGCREPNRFLYWGDLDEVKVYDYKLSLSEIYWLFNDGILLSYVI